MVKSVFTTGTIPKTVDWTHFKIADLSSILQLIDCEYSNASDHDLQ